MSRENLLMVADSEHDANMLYAVGMFVPDPFIYLRVDGKCHVVVNDLEIDRVRKQAPHCRALSLSACWRKIQSRNAKSRSLGQVIRAILRERRIKKISVPANFPFGLARELRALKIKLKIKEGGFFPERELKSADQVRKISAALIMAEVGLAEGVQALKHARIGKGGRLMYHNAPLTSEKLRSIIEVAVLQAGGLPNHTIVSGGRQGCDPHEPGRGQLHAHQPLILDVFPRSQKTGYFGDITRTVVKGRASEAVRNLYHTVARGQEVAFERMHQDVPAAEVHRAVQQFFNRAGYRTARCDGHMSGFFHGTGHGLGLEIHEAPRLTASSEDVLQAGHVVTVEPGLYYPGLGAVRIEDVALITAKAPRNLTKFEKVLEV